MKPAVVPYLNIRDHIQSGDMLEWRSPGIVGAAIRAVTGKPVNHTSLCLDLPEVLAGHQKLTLEANFHGVEANSISARLDDFHGEVYWSALKPIYNPARPAVVRWALMHLGKPYDFGSLFRNLFGRVSTDARRLFCSELYFMALRSAGIVGGAVAPRPGEFGQFKIHYPAIRIK